MRKRDFFIVVGIFLILGAVVFGRSSKSPTAPRFESATALSSSVPIQPDWSKIPGALVRVRMQSRVGVLLEEIPSERREQFVQMLLAKPESFWTERAKVQVRLTSIRLSYRNHPEKKQKQLPLPPEEVWTIQLQDRPLRQKIDGHDVVAVGYTFSSILLTDKNSPGETEPALKTIGGVWSEPFVFPVDPEFIFQRTGFACMNEAEFPPNSMDAEETDLYYDQECNVEKELSNTGCHQTVLPRMSCVAAVTAKIGKVQTAMQFEREPWNAALADKVRLGKVTNPDGPDLEPDHEEFVHHRVTYRYIPKNSCTITERCVGGPGWRQLLMFPTADLNAGAKPLDIGFVDYFLERKDSVLAKHGVFEFSTCHQHYHFSHYGSFTLGDGSEAMTRKNGFCLQPTTRIWNNELSPLHHPYTDCLEQGVSVGWLDEYKMGLECQWIDVTDVRHGTEYPLSFTSNPDGLLCEGTLQRDQQGNQLFEPTNFKTTAGGPVEKPKCNFYPKWASNNTESTQVRIPEIAESSVTEPCRDGLFGVLRNCGLQNKKQLHECKTGKKVTVHCTAPAGSAAQVLRICEASRALQGGIPCTYNDALASATIDSQKDVTFTCPAARDAVETGGAYSFLTGPFFPGDTSTDVICTVKEQAY